MGNLCSVLLLHLTEGTTLRITITYDSISLGKLSTLKCQTGPRYLTYFSVLGALCIFIDPIEMFKHSWTPVTPRRSFIDAQTI